MTPFPLLLYFDLMRKMFCPVKQCPPTVPPEPPRYLQWKLNSLGQDHWTADVWRPLLHHSLPQTTPPGEAHCRVAASSSPLPSPSIPLSLSLLPYSGTCVYALAYVCTYILYVCGCGTGGCGMYVGVVLIGVVLVGVVLVGGMLCVEVLLSISFVRHAA